MNLLTINAGSSSIKYKVFQSHKKHPTPFVAGLIDGIGESSGGAWRHNDQSSTHQFKNHQQAFDELAIKLKQDLHNHRIAGVAHRVVHGGEDYFQPTIITPTVLKKIQDLAQLAPIHNPINAAGIEWAQMHFSEALHIAIFDSGFHHTMPPHIHQYAIHAEVAARYQIKRYGFHGINHEYVAEEAASYLKKPIEHCNFISLHLGNGASACLIKQGLSFDTTMGMTPLAGLIMGTRCGDIDPAIPLYLQQQGMSIQEVDSLLNKQSGLKGIGKDNDMRQLSTRALQGEEAAMLAIEMYVYSIQKIIGAYNGQLPNLDALIFTGGIGENAALIREKIIQPLQHLNFKLDLSSNSNPNTETCRTISNNGKLILVICGDEEVLMARKITDIMTKQPS